jgi:hypothetical protein
MNQAAVLLRLAGCLVEGRRKAFALHWATSIVLAASPLVVLGR